MSDGELLLCCLLWANEGEASGLRAYEDGVLALLPEYGGQLVQRAVGEGTDDHPDEVQILRFSSQASLDAYLADPRRAARAAERDRVIGRTELFPIRLR